VPDGGKGAFNGVRNRLKIAVPARSAGTGLVPAYGATIRDEGHREHASGQADVFDEPRARVSSWPPLRPTRLRRERGSVVVVSPTAPIGCNEEEQLMRRVIGMDLHRTFAEVVFWEDGKLCPTGRVSMTRAGLEGFGRSLSRKDEIVIEATGNAMAVVRVLSSYVARVIIANPLQVKAIAHAHVKTDRSMPGCWRRCGPPTFYPKSGCPTPIPSAAGGWWHGATRSSGTARGSRTRCTRFCTPI
jgi:hypothetical protein